MDDVRYSELIFLQKLAANSPDFQYFRVNEPQLKIVGLNPIAYLEMAVTLLEEWNICFARDEMQLIVARLRGELDPAHRVPNGIPNHCWANPRQGIQEILSQQNLYQLRVTYKGLRRIEELRELLRRDRILEHFGILLDLRYVHHDLQLALQRSGDTAISVLYLDLDGFKRINDNFGHDAGDVVLKSYLEMVRHLLGSFGTGYRGRGDEVVAIVIGQGHKRAVEIAEQIRVGIETMRCKHAENDLPSVTASIGVATTPPETRTMDILSVAEGRNREVKTTGKNRVS